MVLDFVDNCTLSVGCLQHFGDDRDDQVQDGDVDESLLGQPDDFVFFRVLFHRFVSFCFLWLTVPDSCNRIIVDATIIVNRNIDEMTIFLKSFFWGGIIVGKTARTRQPAVAECMTFAGASLAVGVPATTLRSAAERGEIETATTACGATLIVSESVSAWIKRRPKPGPKPAPATTSH